MYDENQLVEIQWANKTRKIYESRGYVFTKYGDSFFVKAKDLTSGSSARVCITCDFCGKEHFVNFANYNKRADKSVDACNDCKVHKQWAKTKSQRAKEKFDIIRAICKDKDYELITDESEYTNVLMTIEYRCKKHGLQKQSMDNMIHGHGCYSCSYEQRGLNCRHSIEYVTMIIESYNGNKLLNPDEYIGSNKHNLMIQCGSCGRVYETSFSDYTNNMQIRCKSCSKRESIGEMRIRKFLECCDINFIQEKKFDDCCDIRPLPFDFYLPERNLIIEFDGKQHFEEVTFGNYEYIKRHDGIKNQYCKDNDIDLLRIPYWLVNDIEAILVKKLNL